MLLLFIVFDSDFNFPKKICMCNVFVIQISLHETWSDKPVIASLCIHVGSGLRCTILCKMLNSLQWKLEAQKCLCLENILCRTVSIVCVCVFVLAAGECSKHVCWLTSTNHAHFQSESIRKLIIVQRRLIFIDTSFAGN